MTDVVANAIAQLQTLQGQGNLDIRQIRSIANGLSVDLPNSVDTFVFYSGEYLSDVDTATGDRVGVSSLSAA